MSDWKQVGEIGVDAGLCWIGDPCYILQNDHKSPRFASWRAFLDELHAIEKDLAASFPYELGHEGLGVCVSTGWGDGSYPVFIKTGEEGRIAEAKVVFMEPKKKRGRRKRAK